MCPPNTKPLSLNSDETVVSGDECIDLKDKVVDIDDDDDDDDDNDDTNSI